MKISENVKLALIFIVLAIVGIVPFIWPDHKVVVMYDCRLAEISPDFPQAAKQLCRRKMEKQ